jgi:hypothetical protein
MKRNRKRTPQDRGALAARYPVQTSDAVPTPRWLYALTKASSDATLARIGESATSGGAEGETPGRTAP